MAYRIMRAAKDQIDAVIIRSTRDHGTEAARRYSLLILAAMTAVGDAPQLPGSNNVPRLPGIRAYPTRLSRRVVDPSHRVRTPRHVVVYRVAPDGVVEILGIVHDRMILSRAARRAIRSADKA